MNPMNPKEINTTALAYIGDAVYEIYVREHVLEASGQIRSNRCKLAQEQSLQERSMQTAAGKIKGTGKAGKTQAFGAHVDALHKKAVRYVRADGQAKALRRMLKEGFLTAEEEALVRRARNHKSASKPKNADAMDYKYATALEALIGYWYLAARSSSDEAGGMEMQSVDPEKQENEGLTDAADMQDVQPAPADKAEARMEEIIFKAFSLIEKG